MVTKPVHFPRLKRRANYSEYGNYHDYRQEIREDCLQRCVYCDGHEKEIGGEENMTLDHFRPKRYPEYKDLEHDPYNLMWACSPCNTNKGEDWPAYGIEGTVNGRCGYIDPFEEDRKEFFQVEMDGRLFPIKDPAEYIIKSLALNRPFLVDMRHNRELMFRTLKKVEDFFLTEIGAFDKLLIALDLNKLEKARLKDEQNTIKNTLRNVRELGHRFTADRD